MSIRFNLRIRPRQRLRGMKGMAVRVKDAVVHECVDDKGVFACVGKKVWEAFSSTH
ncbi:MAG: hypothetical protein Ct9H300mP19_10460 [Dehalococcoidia bacterium]|nr:MAG: hypothetical protein Ct9H300mP19_10460 [Dehalococcoidia bacterium]